MKTSGKIITFGGAVLVIVGAVTLSNVETTSNGYGQSTTSGNLGGGIVSTLSGVSAIGAGVPLWIIGGVKKNRYERKLKSLSVSLRITSQHNGVGIRYRF